MEMNIAAIPILVEASRKSICCSLTMVIQRHEFDSIGNGQAHSEYSYLIKGFG